MLRKQLEALQAFLTVSNHRGAVIFPILFELEYGPARFDDASLYDDHDDKLGGIRDGGSELAWFSE